MKKIKTKNHEIECAVEFENDEVLILSVYNFSSKLGNKLTYSKILEEAYFVEIDGLNYKTKWASTHVIAYEKTN